MGEDRGDGERWFRHRERRCFAVGGSSSFLCSEEGLIDVYRVCDRVVPLFFGSGKEQIAFRTVLVQVFFVADGFRVRFESLVAIRTIP